MANSKRNVDWLAPTLFTAALFLAAEFLLRLTGFQYANTPIGLRYAASIARIGGSRVQREKIFRIDYILDPVLLWKPKAMPGLTNSEGFLGPEWKEQKSSGKKRVITLGDSCTMAGDPPYPDLLQKNLGAKAEVLNAGVGSWSSYQGLELLRGKLLRYHPDVVTIYFGWNDHWLAWAAPDKELSSLLDRQWRLRNAVNKSRVLQALMKLINVFSDGPHFTASTPYRVSIDDYEENLVAMAHLVQSAGSRAVLITAPTVLTPGHPVTRQLCQETHNFYDPKLIRQVHAAYNLRVRQAAQRSGAAVVDLEREFAQENDPRPFFTDGIHLSAAGHRRVARALCLALGRLGI